MNRVNDLLYYFKTIQTNNLECNKELYGVIDQMFAEIRKYNPNYISPGYLKDMIAKASETFMQKWNATLYICDETNYEIVFWCYSSSTSQYHIDQFGNFYLNKKMFLSNLNYRHFYTHDDDERKPINYNPILQLETLEAGFYEIFGENGKKVLQNFCRVFNASHDTEEIFRNFKTIFPFFNVLSLPNLPQVNFITTSGQTSFTIQLGESRMKEFDYTRSNYEIFENVKKFVENSVMTAAFSPHCQEIFADICQNRIPWQINLNRFENYKWYINKRFEGDKEYAEGCHQIAYSLLENDTIQPIHTLNELQFLVFWIRHKTIIQWYSDAALKNPLNVVAGSRRKIRNYVTQFTTLYDEIQNMDYLFHYRFPNFCSATYHINVHYNEMKLATDRLSLTNCPIFISDDLKTLKKMSQDLSIHEDMGSDLENDITNIPDLYNCVQFYLITIPTFLFNNNFYNNNVHKDHGYYKTNEVKDNGTLQLKYIAGNNLKGIKSTTIPLIFSMYPNDNDNYDWTQETAED